MSLRASPSRASEARFSRASEDAATVTQEPQRSEQRETALRSNDDDAPEKVDNEPNPTQPSRPASYLSHPPAIDPSTPNPFTTLTPAQIYGFMSPSSSRALTASQDPTLDPTPTHYHSPTFLEAHRPLAPGESLFDPTMDQRRRDNIVGGWTARDGSATPRPDVVNWEMEPVRGIKVEVGVAMWKKTHRGKRAGRKVKSGGRGGGLRRDGRIRGVRGGVVGGRRDSGGSARTEEGEVDEKGEGAYKLNPEARDFRPGGVS